ncbi:MAG: L,D-transpeptidase family protein [Opitutales bacterium]
MSIIPTPRVLIVSIGQQKLYFLSGEKEEVVLSVSTSKNPPSCKAESYGTPLGLHAIADRIGDGEPEGTVFKGRVPQGHYRDLPEMDQSRNLITSRILRLRGLQAGKNLGPGCDSYERYIYIHGTNHEDRIGEPFSGGCIELRNDAIIQLFNEVATGDLVWITLN